MHFLPRFPYAGDDISLVESFRMPEHQSFWDACCFFKASTRQTSTCSARPHAVALFSVYHLTVHRIQAYSALSLLRFPILDLSVQRNRKHIASFPIWWHVASRSAVRLCRREDFVSLEEWREDNSYQNSSCPIITFLRPTLHSIVSCEGWKQDEAAYSLLLIPSLAWQGNLP